MIPILSVMVVLTAMAQIAEHRHIFGINGTPILCVPESDMNRALLPYADKGTDLHVGSGHTPGFAFLFTSAMMRSIIDGYHVAPGFDGHPSVNHLAGSIGFLGEDDRKRLGPAMRARDTEDTWYARDKCRRPVVEAMDEKLYEIKCYAGASYSAIWSRPPDSRKIMPNPHDFIVATCVYRDISAGPYEGKTLRDCRRVTIIDEFLIDYRVQRENVVFFEMIDLMIKNKILEWRRSCSI